MTVRLAHFAIEADGESYRLRLTLEDGSILARPLKQPIIGICPRAEATSARCASGRA